MYEYIAYFDDCDCLNCTRIRGKYEHLVALQERLVALLERLLARDEPA